MNGYLDYSDEDTFPYPLQYYFSDDPFRMLVVCILLNVSRGKTVRKLVSRLFLYYPSPQDFIDAPEGTMEAMLAISGLGKRKETMIKRLARFEIDVGIRPTTVAEAPGVGRYALESYKIFCQGIDVEDPKDKILKRWKNGW